MLSNFSKRYIEKKFLNLRQNHAFFKSGVTVRWDASDKKIYLGTLRFIFLQTCVHLRNAGFKASVDKNFEMKSFFEQKMAEEAGHEKWAEDDAQKASISIETLEKHIAPEGVMLMNYVSGIIKSNYKSYVFYMLVAEYFAVLMSPVLFEKLSMHHETRHSLSSISNHEAADKHHIVADFEAIDSFFEYTDENVLELKNIVDFSFSIFATFYLRFTEKENAYLIRPMEN